MECNNWGLTTAASPETWVCTLLFPRPPLGIPEELGIGVTETGDKVFKIGAATGMTSGIVNGTNLLNYQ
jgi:hypothetical protein